MSAKISYAALSFFPLFVLSFCRFFPGVKKIDLFHYIFYGLAGLVFAGLFLSNAMLVDIKALPWGYSLKFSDLFLIFAVFFAFSIFHGIYLLAKKYFKYEGVLRAEIGYMLGAILIAFLPIFTFNIVLPFGATSKFLFLGQLGGFVSTLYFAYLIGRFKVMGLDFILNKGVAYAGSAFLFLGIYVGISYVAGLFFWRSGREFIFLFSGIFAVITSLAYYPFSSFILSLSETVLFGKGLNFDKQISSLLNRLENKKFGEEYVGEVIKNFTRTLLVSKVAILKKADATYYSYICNIEGIVGHCPDIKVEEGGRIVKWLKNFKAILSLDDANDFLSRKRAPDEKFCDPDAGVHELVEEIQKSGMSLFAPIIRGDELVGIIAVSRKVSGEPFFKEERAFIMSVADQLSLG